MAALIVGAMGISGFRSMRASVAPTGYWALGWAALAASGGFALLARSTPEVSPLSAVLGTLFAPLMLAGALQHVGRTVPRWLLPAAAALGAGSYLLATTGVESSAWGTAVGLFLLFMVTCIVLLGIRRSVLATMVILVLVAVGILVQTVHGSSSS